jgi:hypothetical protein
MSPQFAVGQTVQPNDGHVASAIVGISIDANGIHYTVAANWMDPTTEEIFSNAVRIYDESELSAVVTGGTDGS